MYVFLYQEYLDKRTPVKMTFSPAPADSQSAAEQTITVHEFSLA